MPFKAFKADVAAAQAQPLPQVTGIRRDEEGEVSFTIKLPKHAPVDVGLLVLDVSEYPQSDCLVFCKSEEPSTAVASTFDSLAKSLRGLTVAESIEYISKKLESVLIGSPRKSRYHLRGTPPRAEADPVSKDIGSDDEDDEEEWEYPGEDYMDCDDGFGSQHVQVAPLDARDEAALNNRIARDLQAVRNAGFRFGVISGMSPVAASSLLSISLRVAKLGISEDALAAWDLDPTHYIILLVRYRGRYKPFEALTRGGIAEAGLEFKIGVGPSSKPKLSEALAAFAIPKDSRGSGDQEAHTSTSTLAASSFCSIFMSQSLESLLKDEFLSLLKIRLATSGGWDAAKDILESEKGRFATNDISSLPSQAEPDTPPPGKLLPPLLLADEVSEKAAAEVSMPLVIAQFTFRFLVRCTEFCLVCHNRIASDFEALKPYVCEKPLCLYQYMALFGPNIEHDLLAQPYVVDLLVSLCYTAALRGSLREHPTGLAMAVPPMHGLSTMQNTTYPAVSAQSKRPAAFSTPSAVSSHTVKYNVAEQQIVLESSQNFRIRHGDWVIVSIPGHPKTHHPVKHVSPAMVQLGQGIVQKASIMTNDLTGAAAPGTLAAKAAVTPVATPDGTPPPNTVTTADMFIYDQNFDDLNNDHKCETIVMLLQTLPSIKELLDYVVKQGTRPSLASWTDRISKAALGLLRWIIASNRSCLVQVDVVPGVDVGPINKRALHPEQKINNIGPEYMQFRFAQGAPDKEQRFLKALHQQSACLPSEYPTLFAFHGSPVYNWHSIIRSGLDFKETANGRAYGHGVYHALTQHVSLGYARGEAYCWPGSELQITHVMSVNELVNHTAAYTSCHPYLVVQHVDWVQCRYLLCKVTPRDVNTGPVNQRSESTVQEYISQDPRFPARVSAEAKIPIAIPQCAISTSKQLRAQAGERPPTKKARLSRDPEDAVEAGTLFSEAEDQEDLAYLRLAAEESMDPANNDDVVMLGYNESDGQHAKKDFIPGSLDLSTLPLLGQPQYATSAATKSLQRELRAIFRVQQSTPLHELGWYVNENVDNMYQWIVELHSFDPDLPLAQDMKSAGVTSIVIQIRFGKDYPMSPPFVRIIRPRFLPFNAGGGGHVTAGGAMCMELLTNSGWSAASSIESVLLQVRLELMTLEPKPARLEGRGRVGQVRDYGTGEAMEAYRRACKTHGWQVPKDFEDFATDVPADSVMF